MIPWSLLAAVAGAAGPLASTRPLPDCAPDTPRQLVLPNRIEDLAFDPSGDLVVADRAGLTVRDPQTLAVRARWAEGIGGWTSVWREGDVLRAASALGPTVSVAPGQPPQLGGRRWAFGGALGGGPRWNPAIVGGREVQPVGDDREVAVVDGVVYRLHGPGAEDRTGRGEALGIELLTFDPWSSMGELLRPAERRPVRWIMPDRVAVEVVAADLDATGRRLALATTRELLVLDLERREVLAREPLLVGADAAGLVDGRLFTVSDGALALWDADGRRTWTAPGVYASAIARPKGRLLATTLAGELVTVDLDKGRVRPALAGRSSCLAPGCDAAAPEPALPPSPPADPALREAWQAAVYGWALDAARAAEQAEAHPIGLVEAGPWVVAAEWLDVLWRSEGVAATTALKVLDAEGRKVLAERALPRPVAATPRFVAPDTVVVGDQAWRLPDLEPLARAPLPPDGAVEVVIEESRRRGYDRIVLGTWQHGVLVGDRGLPWRWVPEARRQSFATLAGDRFVLASRGRDPRQLTGPVAVWCRPPAGADGGADEPGLIAEVPSGDPATTAQERLDAALMAMERRHDRSPEGFGAGTPLRGVEHRVAPTGSGAEVWVEVDRPGLAPQRVLDLEDGGHPVRLVLPYPPQPGEVVPPGVGWSVTVGSGPQGPTWRPSGSGAWAWIVAAETTLWSGPIEDLPEALLTPGPPFGGPVDPALLTEWRAGPGKPSPEHRGAERAHAGEAVRVALAAGHLDVVRELAPVWLSDWTLFKDPEAGAARAVLAAGRPFPAAEVRWLEEPPTGWVAVVVAPPYLSEVLNVAPPEVPTVAVLLEGDKDAAKVPRAVRTGVLKGAPQRLGVNPGTWLLVRPDGVIAWAGAAEDLAEAVEAHGL